MSLHLCALQLQSPERLCMEDYRHFQITAQQTVRSDALAPFLTGRKQQQQQQHFANVKINTQSMEKMI